ncbi:MAG: acetamidase/formamidase family protein [Chloroflexi bacterium]|nr:acetamidase/formamidase family protein [Chloroflexota bacterium]
MTATGARILTRGLVHHAWDKSITPLLTIDSGDTVVFETRDASDGFMTPAITAADLAVQRPFRGHPLTGPVYIRDAAPGDTLEIEILELRPGSFGWTRFSPGRGLLPDDFDAPFHHIWDLTRDPAPFVKGISVPLEPFLGVMGVALAEPGAHSTMPPRRNGGNIDTKQLTAGSRMYLPVLVEGALFSCGDGHAAQGDGEVCITAIECAMTATLRFTLHKGRAMPEFQFRTAGPLLARTNSREWYATTGHGPDLMEAARNAIRHMIGHLVDQHGLTRAEAYILCSVAVDLKLSEVVDAPNWVVSAFLPMSLFSE